MDKEFKNEYLKQVYTDFSSHTKDFDLDMQHALQDFEAAFKKAHTDKEKAALADELTALTAECAEKFAAGLNTASPKNKNEWPQKLADCLVLTMNLNPKNIPSLIGSVLKMEKSRQDGNAEILTRIAKEVTFKHPQYTPKLLQALDEFTAHYDDHPHQNIKTYDNLYKAYTDIYGKPRDKKIADHAIAMANGVYYKTDFLKNDSTFDKSIQRIQKKPEDEVLTDAFEISAKQAFRTNPEKAAENILANLKNITQIADTDKRGELYGLILDSIANAIPSPTDEAMQAKSDIMMTFINKALKAEKDEEARGDFAFAALSFVCSGITDENGGLIVADGREKQAFGALDKLADNVGHRVELWQLLSATAEKFKDRKDIIELAENTLIKAFANADKTGKRSRDEYEPTAFVKRVFNTYTKRKNIRRLNNEICALLNISYLSNSDYQYDYERKGPPSKSDMQKAVNRLFQYPVLEGYLPDLMLQKIDTKQFSNVDDALLNSFEKAIALAKDKDELLKKITGIRTQLHSFNVTEKKKHNTDNKDDKPAVDATKKKTIADHAPKKFTLPFDPSDASKEAEL